MLTIASEIMGAAYVATVCVCHRGAPVAAQSLA